MARRLDFKRIDFIGDVHGWSGRLRDLLEHLGYVRRGWTYRHPDPDRGAVFMGDLIDGGPGQVEVYVVVRRMVEDGTAACLMGNHEFDAIAWTTPDPRTGWPMQDRTDVNWARHRAFLSQVGENSRLHRDMIRWFRTLPLFVETPDWRAVHACWHAPSAGILRRHLDCSGRVRPESWPELLDRRAEAGAAASLLVRGPEFAAPTRCDGRLPMRAKWWAEHAATVGEAAVDPASADPDTSALPFDASAYRNDGRPLFFAHYGDRCPPRLVGDNAVCVDNYAGARRPLLAYAWRGESRLSLDGLECADPVLPALAAAP